LSLPQLRHPPDTKNGFDEWSFQHFAHHQAIIAAAQSGKNTRLTLYNIWPFSFDNAQNWLLQHQAQHNDMNALYKQSGSDFTSVDFRDKRALDAFFDLHFREHQAIAALCGVPI
jgi:DNA-binding GntR family transcriptional regulator